MGSLLSLWSKGEMLLTFFFLNVAFSSPLERKRKKSVHFECDFLVATLLSSLSPKSLKGWKIVGNFRVAQAHESSLQT